MVSQFRFVHRISRRHRCRESLTESRQERFRWGIPAGDHILRLYQKERVEATSPWLHIAIAYLLLLKCPYDQISSIERPGRQLRELVAATLFSGEDAKFFRG